MTNANGPEHSPTGQAGALRGPVRPVVAVPDLAPPKRAELGLHGAVPFFGADLWTAFELSWLTPRGKPQVAMAHITVPCETPNLVESKSFKLYINSFSNTPFASADEVRDAHPRRRERGRLARRGQPVHRWACGCCCPTSSTASRCTSSMA